MAKDDITQVVDLWYETSILAHHFIAKTYWEKNKRSMEKKYLPMAETFVAWDGEEILGFISLVDHQLAALFVKPSWQGKGMGSFLLAYAKDLHKKLQLKAYKKNTKAVEFYKTKGFIILAESMDETGEKEFMMEWHR